MPTIAEVLGPNGSVIPSATYTNDVSPEVEVTLSSGAAAGDLLYLTDAGARVGPTLTLTADQVTAGHVEIQLAGLPDGWHPLIANLADASGALLSSSNPYGVAISTETVAAPGVTGVTAGGAGLADGATTASSSLVFSLTEAGAPPPPTSSPGHSPYGGPALLGGTIEILDGQTVVGTGVIGYGGQVSVTTQALAPGAHTLTAEAIDRAGNASPLSAAFHVTIEGSQQAAAGATLDSAIQAVLREAPSDPSVAQLEHSLSGQIAAGSLDLSGAVTALAHAAEASTSVATLAYQFFTGSTPGAAGLDYLVASPGPNPDSLNSAYYQAFSPENRYINFAVNLGSGSGAGAAAFLQAYGGEDLAAATGQAYAAIFGAAPSAAKVADILDATVVSGGQSMTRADYFALYGGDGPNGIATKAAMAGWLLAEAANADLGTYAKANDAYLHDLGMGTGAYGVDLIGHYAQAGMAYGG